VIVGSAVGLSVIGATVEVDDGVTDAATLGSLVGLNVGISTGG
jgi:hypothetical protein